MNEPIEREANLTETEFEDFEDIVSEDILKDE